ncbi:MAG: ABC transporter ATP-binding protein [Planctomycetota bacterium]
MHQFWRATKLALRYRWTIAGICLSSIAIALLWGANLSTVYPIVDVVLKDRSLRNWVDEQYNQATESRQQNEAELARLQGEADPDDRSDRARRKRVGRLESRIEADKAAQSRAKFLQPWIYRFTPNSPFKTLVAVVALLLLGTLLKSLFIVADYVLVQRVSQLVAFDLRKQLHRQTLRLSLDQFGDSQNPQLLSHFTHDMECLALGVKTIFGRALREPLKIAACLIGAAWISWQLLTFSLVVTPVAIVVIHRMAKFVKRASRRSMEEMSLMFERLSETLSHIRLVKAFTREKYERRRFHNSAKDYLHQTMRVAFFDAVSRPWNELMGMAVIGLSLITGGYMVLNQETHFLGIKMCERPMNFGALMTFFALLAGVSDPFRKLADVYTEIQKGAAASERIFKLIDAQPTVPCSQTPQPIEQPLQSIRFDRVQFSYLPGVQVLHDIDLEIKRGEIVAIIGPNGCGKSTLTQLISRFYDPTQGQVLWNGTDLRELRKSHLRRRIGLVSQHAMLFNDTVIENLRYGMEAARDEEVWEAARRADAHGFITEKLAAGYETRVGPNGFALSGGQRQRLSLARAILRDPELLVLDEATSQIDVESERSLRQALLEFCQDRTAVVITHRPETLELATRIVVMDGGRILDQGTHLELLAKSTAYRRFHQEHDRISA